MAAYNRSSSRGRSTGETGTMSRSQAGHLGGVAPHRCRGRQCSEQGSTRSTSSRGTTSRRTSSSNGRRSRNTGSSWLGWFEGE